MEEIDTTICLKKTNKNQKMAKTLVIQKRKEILKWLHK